MSQDRSALARLPKVDQVLLAEPLARADWRREIKKRLVVDEVARLRTQILGGEAVDVPTAQSLAQRVARRLDSWSVPRPRRVINATGVVGHTNIGRAPLSDAAIDAMVSASRYCDLEMGLDDGRRGSRFVWLKDLIAVATGAQDAHVVNNNGAALLLACTVLGDPGGVVLSRGQMVEIGDGFRVATMAAAGGCRVVEVGSTNRTHLRDYEQAIAPEGGQAGASAVLWAHQSNFRQHGFVAEVTMADLSALCRKHRVPLIADLGSGYLGGLPGGEPTISQYLEQGADLVLASGDKLLGGPQAGLIVGRTADVHRCRRHPMARALRPDKTTIAALHATFVAHARPGPPNLPFYDIVAREPEALRNRADALCRRLDWSRSAVVDTRAAIGGGSLPGDTMPSVGLAVPTRKPARIARRLRLGDPPIIGYVEAERLLIDLRAVDPSDDELLAEGLRAALEPEPRE